VTFDPFGDLATRGYLRNVAQEKNVAIVRRLEHASFTTGLDEAFAQLAKRNPLAYADVLATHKLLFDAVYPWAGQDRATTSPDIAVSRGGVLFAHPKFIQNAIEHALTLGSDPKTMRARSGEVMGFLAHGHPFLDGNGRTIMVIHAVLGAARGLQYRLGRDRQECLSGRPDQGTRRSLQGLLDAYLEPYVRAPVPNLAVHLAATKGLDGVTLGADTVQGRNDDPAVQAKYEQQRIKRGE
jgi:cell filamentation protein